MSTTNSNSNPTWYGDIRHFFTSTDIAHMGGMGFDFSTYDGVREHSGKIYQMVVTPQGNRGMPPPPSKPWSQDWKDAFLTWMTNGYPKGSSDSSVVFKPGDLDHKIPKATTATRIRKDVANLSTDEQQKLATCFTELMNRSVNDPSDPNGYFVIAGYHWLPEPNLYCMHHMAGFNPWHRVHLKRFEDAMRTVKGCEDITLPYWDITAKVPDFLESAPFKEYTYPESIGSGHNKGDKTSRHSADTILANVQGNRIPQKLTRAMGKSDWDDFHGMLGGARNNTFINAHDLGHVSIGPTMEDQDIAAFDPIFWFFHCNLDRIYWNWQKKMHATDVNGVLSTINKTTDPASYQIFAVPAAGDLNPFTSNTPNLNAADSVDLVNSMGIDYDPPKKPEVQVKPERKTLLAAAASQKAMVNTSLANVRVKGLNRLKIPGSFHVHLMKDDERLASTSFFQPNEVEKCANCVENAIVHFDFELPLEEVSNGKLSVHVEPLKKDMVGDRFPHKMMGNPTLEVGLVLDHD